MSDYVSHFVSTPDGLKLHVRVYGPPTTGSLPVVCLHGLARTSADFHRVALALSRDAANRRQVIAVDYRGRGRSDYDPNPANYNVGTELNDVLTVLSALAIRPAVFIGTSRGGILTMLLATIRPEAIVGAVLNDIGPVIEPAGLMRIKGYVGKLSQPTSFEHGGEMLRQLLGAQFTSLTADDWTAFARRTFEERQGKLVASYDLALAQTLRLSGSRRFAKAEGARRNPRAFRESHAECGPEPTEELRCPTQSICPIPPTSNCLSIVILPWA
jgi:pimeloyl-ACP methyl ester carboxylesterase